MNWLTRLRKRRSLEQDLEDELAFHQEMRRTDNEAPRFGNKTRIRESMREMWTFHLVETTLRDALFTLRTFRKNPGFALAAIGSLAVGIGVAIAIFTAADDLLFRPMPYPNANRLVMVWERNTRHQIVHNVISPGNFLDWKSRNTVLQDIAAFSEYDTTFGFNDRTERLRIQNVSANYFGLLGVHPWRGRFFTEAEDLSSANTDTLVIVSYRVWQDWFHGDDNVIGQHVLVNALPRTVIGVMPPGFYFRNREVDLWDPAGIDPAKAYRGTSGRYMMAFGLLKPGLEMHEAQSGMSALASQLAIENPVFDANWTVELEPLRDSLVREVRSSLLVLLGAVGLLLAVACTNVANLLLARHSSRRAELAVRMALGSGRPRLLRQLITESLVLSVVASVLGLVIGWLALRGLVALAPKQITQAAEIAIDWRIAALALGAALATGVIFGIVPAFIAARASAASEMRRAGRWSSALGGSARSWLVAGEVAVSVMLLAGASLLFHSLLRLQSTRPGIDPNNVLTFRFGAPTARYPKSADRTRLFARAVGRLRQIPGVTAVSAVSYLPFDGDSAGTDVRIGGRPEPRPGEGIGASIRTVMPGYFDTLRIPLERGRAFTDADNTPGAPYRFIVNEAFAKKNMAGQEPLGQTLSVAMDRVNPYGEIIGVVGDVAEGALGKEPSPTVYYVHTNLAYTAMTFVARTSGDPAAIVPDVRRAMHEIDPLTPVSAVRTMRTVLGETYAREEFSAILLTGFSLSSLLVAAIGIYGVLAFSVSERTREIGVRLAVGAHTGRIVGMVLGDGARFVITGLILGMAGAFWLSKFIASLLFQTDARDPLAFTVAPAALLLVALIAAYLPARKASRLDPISALRIE